MAKRKRFKPPVMLATVFRRARKVLDERGWAQGALETEPGGPCCLLGASRLAAFGHADVNGAESLRSDKLTIYIAGVAGVEYFDVADWNDSPERRKRDVLALLKRAELKAAREKARLVP